MAREQFTKAESKWKSERDHLLAQVKSLTKTLQETSDKSKMNMDAIAAEKRAIENALADAMAKWNTQKLRWEQEVAQLKRRAREEKEELLSRFKLKLGEYERVHREQTEAIEQMKRKQVYPIDSQKHNESTRYDGVCWYRKELMHVVG
jgi:hypothetical protein